MPSVAGFTCATPIRNWLPQCQNQPTSCRAVPGPALAQNPISESCATEILEASRSCKGRPSSSQQETSPTSSSSSVNVCRRTFLVLVYFALHCGSTDTMPVGQLFTWWQELDFRLEICSIVWVIQCLFEMTVALLAKHRISVIFC